MQSQKTLPNREAIDSELTDPSLRMWSSRLRSLYGEIRRTWSPIDEERRVLAPKNYNPTIAFALAVFLGYLGIDRLYTGQIGLGVAKLLTVGGFGIWWIADILIFGVQAFAGASTRSWPSQQGAPLAQFAGERGHTTGAAPTEAHSPPVPRGHGIEPWARSSTMTEVVAGVLPPRNLRAAFPRTTRRWIVESLRDDGIALPRPSQPAR